MSARVVLAALTAAASVLTGCGGASSTGGGSSSAQPSTPTTSASTSASATATPDDQPLRHTRLAHEVCVFEVIAATSAIVRGPAFYNKVRNALGPESEVFLIAQDANLTQLAFQLAVGGGRSVARTERKQASYECGLGANPINNRPNPVLDRGHLARLETLAPKVLVVPLHLIRYFG